MSMLGLGAAWLGYTFFLRIFEAYHGPAKETVICSGCSWGRRIATRESPCTGGSWRRRGRRGLAGATVLRGLEGFGAHSRLHKTGILRLSTDLPIVVEIVDTREKIEEFLPVLWTRVIQEGLATLEKVEIRFYRSGEPES